VRYEESLRAAAGCLRFQRGIPAGEKGGSREVLTGVGKLQGEVIPSSEHRVAARRETPRALGVSYVGRIKKLTFFEKREE